MLTFVLLIDNLKTSVKFYIKPNLSPVDDAIPAGGISLSLCAITMCFYGNNKNFKKTYRKNSSTYCNAFISSIYLSRKNGKQLKW